MLDHYNNIQGDIGTLLGKNYEVEKMLRFLKEPEMFEKIVTLTLSKLNKK